MTYRPITDPTRIEQCFKTFSAAFEGGVHIPEVRPGGHFNPKYRVLWHKNLGIWSCHVNNWRESKKPDWSALFGVGQPARKSSPIIPLQINVYKEEASRIPHGRYFTDDTGTLYIGRTSVANQGRGNSVRILQERPELSKEVVTLDWVRKKNRFEKIILIGAVDEDTLGERVAALVKTVNNIKTGASRQSFSFPTRTPTNNTKTPSFSPEFDVDSEYDQSSKKITVTREHAKIVAALKGELERLGHTVANDGPRDLYIPTTGFDAKVLFEVKKSTDTQDTYTAIGQLMFHGARQQVEPFRVLVAPAGAKPETMKALKRIGIEVVTFTKNKGNKYAFMGLDEVLGKRES